MELIDLSIQLIGSSSGLQVECLQLIVLAA